MKIYKQYQVITPKMNKIIQFCPSVSNIIRMIFNNAALATKTLDQKCCNE